MSDASIGVPKADLSAGSDEPDPETVAVVYTRNGDEWAEYELPAGETMEITLANGERVALVETKETD